MVEHELNVGREIGERDRLVDLVGADAEIEWPAGFRRSRLRLARNSVPSLTVVGHDVQHAAETLDERIGALAIEEFGETGLLRPAGADAAAQQRPGAAASDSTLRVSATMSAGATSTSM